MKTTTINFLICTLLSLVFLSSSCKKESAATPVVEQVSAHINDSLWAFYPLNGNTIDSSNHNHTLSLQNGAKLSFDKWGREFSAIDLDGVDDFGLIQDGTLFPNTNFSVSLFVMPRVNSGFFFGKQEYSTAKAATFNVGIDTRLYGAAPRFAVGTNQAEICDQIPAGAITIFNKAAFYTNAWYHVIISFNNATIKFYVNGDLVGSKLTDSEKLNNCQKGQFIIGSWWLGDPNAFNGKIDDIRIYTRAISDTEVKYLFNKKN